MGKGCRLTDSISIIKSSRSLHIVQRSRPADHAHQHLHVPGRSNGLHDRQVQERLDTDHPVSGALFGRSNLANGKIFKAESCSRTDILSLFISRFPAGTVLSSSSGRLDKWHSTSFKDVVRRWIKTQLPDDCPSLFNSACF